MTANLNHSHVNYENATAISYSETTHSLYIRLENGTVGYVPSNEISKFPIRNPGMFVGQVLHVVPTGETFKDMPVFSAKEVQEKEYQQIYDDFLSGKRNVYTAEYMCTVSGGAVALYTIAPGIVGGIGVQNFCINRFQDLSKLPLPRTLPVTILDMDDTKIHLSSLPAFGTFMQNVERFDIEVGDIIPAYCTSILPDGNAVVMVTPNLVTVISHAPEIGEHVLVRVRKIDFTRNKLKCEYVDNALPGTIFKNFSNYVFEPTQSAIDINAFVDATKTKKVADVIPFESVSENENENENENVNETHKGTDFFKALRSMLTAMI